MTFKRQFGETIPGLKIHGEDAPYPVLDEREVRAAAGVMLVLAGSAFFLALLAKQYYLLQAFVLLFTLEFFIRVVVNPYYAPIFAIGRLLVKNQKPEWVGAIQKKFAWSLGLIMAGSMIIISLLLGIKGWLPFTVCSLCLLFLWAESTLGVCVGCNMYSYMIKKGLIKPEVKAACPGGACSIKRPE